MKPFVQEIETNIVKTFDEVDSWFDEPLKYRLYKPLNNGWSINEILEHLSLTNHFLLILIDKGYSKALKNTNQFDLDLELSKYLNSDKTKLDEVAIHSRFKWIRPEHMEPKGELNMPSFRSLLKQQCSKCKFYLKMMPNGEGALYKTTMSVNNLGKINVYDYITFLANHAKRHITQMQQCKREFINLK